MNDRFKFRVWNIKHRIYCDKMTEMVINSNGVCYDNGVSADYFEHNGFVIEQCTGLKDNCGNLIYEGDIIGDGEDDYVIKWDGNRTMFVAEDIDTSYEIEDVLDPTICVIGNIHEQTEQKD